MSIFSRKNDATMKQMITRQILFSGQFPSRLSQYIRHYEGLSYDTEALHSNHQRAKRALSPHDKTVKLDFHAHGRSVSPLMIFISSVLCTLSLCFPALCCLCVLFCFSSLSNNVYCRCGLV